MSDKELTLWLKLKDDASKAFKVSAKVIAAAALAIGAAVVAAGIKLFKLASDAEEADNVIGLAFGSMKQQAIDWSETFAAATGSSKFESRELAADLGLIIRGMGFTEAATLGMSTQMVELAADMSSAKNVPLAEALDKIRAGLIGESEPLRTMGVLLSEARVKEVAYAEGIAATGAALTVQEKVQARMNIILSDSVAMHGDLINTQDSAANQWRAIQNAVKDNLTTLGQHFMPVFVKVLGYIRDGVNFAISFTKSLYASSKETNRWTEALGHVQVVLGLVWSALKPVVSIVVDGLAAALSLSTQLIGALVDDFNALISNLQTGYNWIARLVPGLEEVGVATVDVSVATDQAAAALEAEAAALEASAAAAAVAAAEDARLEQTKLDLVVATKAEAEAQAAAAAAAAAFKGTIEDQSATLDHWSSQLGGVGKAVELIPPFMSTLSGTIEDQSAALDHWGLDISNMGIQLDPLPLKLEETEQSADKLNVTLAALAGGMGGAAGQAINLAASMIQTNDQLKEGEEGFSNVQIGAAAAGAAFHAMGDAMGGTAGKILSAAGDIATAFATGGPLGAALAGMGLLIKGLMSLGGPSEAELAARETFSAWHKGVVTELGETQRFADEVQVAIAAGWDQTLAEARAGFIIWGQEAGKTYDEAFADYERYQDAVKSGNTALMAQIDEEYSQYQKLSEMMDQVYNTAVSAYDRAKDAGVSAYDKVFEAAIESGKGQEDAARQAGAAQESAIADVLAAEGRKYARIAAFEAALEAIRSGNAEGAAEAARKAARDTSEAWDTAMGVIADADIHATDAMIDNHDRVKDAVIDGAKQMKRDVEASLSALSRRSWQIDIDYRGRRTGQHGSIEGRQHGGPVSAGYPYVVGEGGKEEIFVPGQSGSVVPNNGIPSAEEIGAAVARAMRRTPLVVPRDAVTDAVLGNSPSRRALAGFN